MKDKFFVPYETAKTLVVKYYNEECEHFYNTFGKITTDPTGCKIAAPTYHEVIDWLESKDILIDCTCGFDYHTEKEWYRCFVIERKRRFEDEYISNFAPTREEALNAAILKALELI